MENNKKPENPDTEIVEKELPIDYSALSHDELVAIIKNLKAQLDAFLNPPPNDWHAWFYALLRITFHKFPTVDVLREVMLGVQAPRADFIIIVDDQKVDLVLKIFSFFRKHDILEFKSPDDELNMFTLLKGAGYVFFYMNDVKEKGEGIDLSEITLSFFREAKPVKLFGQLGECVEKGPADGIYYIKNWEVSFPIQIVVTGELKGEEYAGFRAISKKPKEEDVLAFMKEHGSEKEIASFVKAFADGVSHVDSDLMEEIKGRYPEMGKTLMQIMQPEIDVVVKDATAKANEIGKYSQVVNQVRSNNGMFTDNQMIAFMRIEPKTLKIVRFVILKHPDWKDEAVAEEVINLEEDKEFDVDKAVASN